MREDIEIFLASKDEQAILNGLPESGMGYQIIRTKQDSAEYYVFNGTYFIPRLHFDRFFKLCQSISNKIY